MNEEEKDLIIKELKNENQQLKAMIKAQKEHYEQQIKKLMDRITELEKRLLLYENPHTPPSKQIIKKDKKKDNIPKKRGAPKGHKGTTRKRPKPEKIIDVFETRCPHCNTEVGEPIHIEKKIIEELPPPPKIEVTQFNIAEYCCPECGFQFKTKHEDCPQEGGFGVSLMAKITLLKIQIRGVLRKIVNFLKTSDSFDISPAGIQAILLRVGKACKKEYEKIWQRIVNSKYKYGDETSFHVCGKKWWLWIFRTLKEVLVVIRPSRGKKVTKEIFGENPKSCIGADGWSAYRIFEFLQRCWSHLLRVVDDCLKKSENAKRLSEILHCKFKKLKDFQFSEHSMKEREEQKRIWDRETEELVEEFNDFKELKKPVTYLKNALGCWYTCLLFPGMEPTNNLSEQAIREHVIIRKIIGTFRSDKGAENYQYIASMFATWKLQGKNLCEELTNLLRKEICLGEWDLS